MGMEIPKMEDKEHKETDAAALASRPSILLVGPRNVGKRSILNRLTKVAPGTSATGISCHGWTIDTKYYTANVCIWLGRLEHKQLDDGSRIHALSGHCEALVMVFDLSDLSSFEAIQAWVDGAELQAFDILVCVGNKADRVPDHYGHVEYRRRLQKRSESFSDPHPEFMNYGLERTEGSSLLQEDEEPSEDRRRACIQWCSDKGIEYIEACALNETFDQCLSVDGDPQGISRLQGALSAHMWPGMAMKAPSKPGDAPATAPAAVEEVSSDDESEFSIEYELLSNASAEEAWDVSDDQLRLSDRDSAIELSASDASHPDGTAVLHSVHEEEQNNHASANTTSGSSSTVAELMRSSPVEVASAAQRDGHAVQSLQTNSSRELGVDDLERMMQEMVCLRENMRDMSDSHRRDMAASLAIRMAAMFGGDDDEDF